MIDLNPGQAYFGKSFSFIEAQDVQEILLETMPTGAGWYWRDEATGGEVVFSGKRRHGRGKNATPPQKELL